MGNGDFAPQSGSESRELAPVERRRLRDIMGPGKWSIPQRKWKLIYHVTKYCFEWYISSSSAFSLSLQINGASITGRSLRCYFFSSVLSFIKHSLNIYYVPNPVWGSEDTKTKYYGRGSWLITNIPYFLLSLKTELISFSWHVVVQLINIFLSLLWI